MSTLELSQSGSGPLRLPAVSSRADAAIRMSTTAVVLAVAGIAAYRGRTSRGPSRSPRFSRRARP